MPIDYGEEKLTEEEEAIADEISQMKQMKDEIKAAKRRSSRVGKSLFGLRTGLKKLKESANETHEGYLEVRKRLRRL